MIALLPRTNPFLLSSVLARSVLVLVLIAAACSDDSTVGPTDETTTTTTITTSTTTTTTTIEPPRPTVPVPVYIDENGFNDHTVPTVASVDEWFALAAQSNNKAVVKFTISDFRDGNAAIRWVDSASFELHDEWFYYRLLNGQPVPGVGDQPTSGLRFNSIAEIYDWADTQATLPYKMQWIESQTFGRDRLYSERFYDILLRTSPRLYGGGTLVHIPESPDGPRWLIELEFSDDVSPSDLALYFEHIGGSLPAEISDNLEFVIRSPDQRDTADEMAAAGNPLADKIVRWIDVVPPGEVSVYNPGIAAGQLLLVDETGSQLARATDTDILIMEHVPDYLPPASALITSAPQTPLAHVNLLARNRGIPNLSLSGVADNPGVAAAARVRSYVIVRAEGNGVDITLISRDEFLDWQARQEQSTIRVPSVDVDNLPLTFNLSTFARDIRSDEELDEWRPIIGGKSAGYVALLNTPGVTTPPTPIAVTVKPYFEQLALVETTLGAVLANDDFIADPRARYLFLEGPDDFETFYSAPRDLEYGEAIVALHPPESLLGKLLTAGGFKSFFRDQPMDRATLAELTSTLESTFGRYDDTQGLRFRSSSSVEDIEGFNGAGLYNSNTGFLDAKAQPDRSDQDKTIEETIKKTWASYWAFEAFEERRREKVDHRSGGMGVLVHARFDDELEQNNGVATFTLAPAGSFWTGTAVINTQAGSVSVANPDPTSRDLPEVIEAIIDLDGDISITRVQESNVSPGVILNDAAVDELVEQLEATTKTWRRLVNATLDPVRQVSVVTLDFEFKTMAEGWPAGASNDDGGLIVKQARSLDPGLRGVPSSVVNRAIPRDVLARAARVTELTCDGRRVTAVWTDPLIGPDMGYSIVPYTNPSMPDRAGCSSRTLYSTPDQFLEELLETGERMDLTG